MLGSLSTVNSRFKKDLKLQIHLHKAFFSDNRFLDSLHKSFLNQTTIDLRKEKWTFLNREFTVLFLLLNILPNQTSLQIAVGFLLYLCFYLCFLKGKKSPFGLSTYSLRV